MKISFFILGLICFFYQQILGQLYNPINLPTFDNKPSVTHCSVAQNNNLFLGYRYFMAYTPYPDVSRERPHLVASNDLIHWSEIPNIKNPFIPYTIPLQYNLQFNSDPDIVFVKDTLYYYFRPIYGRQNAEYDELIILCKLYPNEDTNYFKTNLFSINDNVFEILSPSVIYTDHKFQLWYVNSLGEIIRTESNDGLEFVNKISCSISDNKKFWHIEILYDESNFFKYIGLFLIKNTYELFIYYSSDGINWINSGQKLYKPEYLKGFYRSSVLKLNNEFLIFPVIVLNDSTTIFNSTHRICNPIIINSTYLTEDEDVELQNDFRIYPNPSNGIVNIVLDNYEDFQIKLFNLLGEEIKIDKINRFQNTIYIDKSGIYFLLVKSNRKYFIKKIIILK